MKRIGSLLLSFVMLVCIMPLSAVATSPVEADAEKLIFDMDLSTYATDGKVYYTKEDIFVKSEYEKYKNGLTIQKGFVRNDSQSDIKISTLLSKFMPHVATIAQRPIPKQKADAPDSRKADECVDYPAKKSTLTSKDPCHKVKLKSPYQSPVKGANNGQDQRCCIHICFLPD